MKKRKRVSTKNWPGNRPSEEMNEYFFILGRERLICLAELLCVLKHKGVSAGSISVEGPAAIVRTTEGLDCRDLLAVLGGTVKAGRLYGTVERPEADRIWQLLCVKGLMDSLKVHEQKVAFGVSIYPGEKQESLPIRDRCSLIDDVNKLAKASLKEVGISCRYLSSQGSSRAEPVSSAQILKSHTLEKGAEVCLVWTGQGIHVGSTESVQDLDKYARMDMEKPSRRVDEGLLPPKLARMLVNLSRKPGDTILLDPFCGSGVVLMEALQIGLNVIGNDIEADAVDASKANVAWLYDNEEGLPDEKINRFICYDARRLTEKNAPLSIDAIATEPYLGPALRRPANAAEATRILSGLATLYTEAFAELRILLKPGGRLVTVIPRFAGKGHGFGMNLKDDLELMGYRIINPLEGSGIEMEHPYLLYSRKGQKVQREIWVLENPA